MAPAGKPTVVSFSSGGLTDAFKILLYGDPAADEVLFFQPGWPDDHGAFEPLACEMAARGCLCGVSCFPGFDRSVALKDAGFDWPEVSSHCNDAIHALLERSTAGVSAVTLVLHDWGCIGGVWFAGDHPGRVKRIALLDVGPTYAPALVEQHAASLVRSKVGAAWRSPLHKLYGLAIIVHYQLWFCVAYWLNRYVSRQLASLLGQVIMAVLFQSPLRHLLSPVNSNEKVPRAAEEVQPFMFYPYAQTWKRVLFISGSIRELAGAAAKINAPDPSKVPTLFLYGKDKNAFFHDEKDLAVLEGCGQVYAGLPGGHWFYYYESRIATLNYVCDFVGVPRTL